MVGRCLFGCRPYYLRPFLKKKCVEGNIYKNKSYIWPTIGDTEIPDITTGAFQGYLESLISLASFHDEYDSDNLWRIMTHESIKNLDWTFTSKKGDEEKDLSDFNTTGVEAMLRIQGRQFDDIKRYADNIKNTNAITYDEKGNLPDYFLSDIITLYRELCAKAIPICGIILASIIYSIIFNKIINDIIQLIFLCKGDML